MKMNMLWAGVLGLTTGLATNGVLAAADKSTDFAAEQAQIAKEEADQQAEREKGIKGKYQRVFYGTVYMNTQVNQEISPDVVGFFLTSKRDAKPGRTYQMKLRESSKALAAVLKQMNGKPVKLTGILRFIGANGEAKYLIVDSVAENGSTPTVMERRSASGL